MEYRRLGTTGLMVSELCLGTMTFGRELDVDGSRAMIRRFLEATKVRFPMGEGSNDVGLSRKHIISGCDASLGRLGTDHIDLYQVHA